MLPEALKKPQDYHYIPNIEGVAKKAALFFCAVIRFDYYCCMYLKIAYILSLLLLLTTQLARAQEPSYTIVGKEELAGIDIYSIIQDDKYNIILATNHGLMRYDGYEYYHYPSHNLQSLSLFGLLKNSKKEIFCFSLRGQILKIEADSLTVFCEIPDSLLSPDFSMNFDKNDDLIVGGNHPFRVSPQGIIQEIRLPYNPSPYIGRTSSGDILFAKNSTDTISLYSSKKIRHLNFPLYSHSQLFFSSCKEGSYINEINTYNLYKLEGDSIYKIDLEAPAMNSGSIPHLIFTPENESIWITTRTGGVHVFSRKGKALFQGHKLYGNYYISAFLEDKEGNFWFPTLGKGILYVSNANMKSYASHPSFIDETFVFTAYDKVGNIYLSSGSGKIFQLRTDEQVNLLYNNPLWKFSFLQYNPDQHSLYFNQSTSINILQIDTRALKQMKIPPSGSIKDIAYFHPDSFVTVSSGGIDYFNIHNREQKAFSIPIGRCHRLFFEEQGQQLWVLTSKGVFLLKDRRLIPFLDGKTRIYANAVSGNASEVWLAASNKGIYRIKDGKIIQRMQTDSGLSSLMITKMLLKGKLLFIAHQKGIQIYHTETGVFNSLRANDGLASNHILDFDVFENEICVVTSENVQRIQLDIIDKNGTPPFLELLKVEINGEPTDRQKLGDFTHRQNQIEFHFKAKAYQHRGELTYLYKLEGADSDWKCGLVNENKVKYLSLSPGKYTFHVKALNENDIASKTLYYDFVIHPPFWTTWWFLITAISTAVGMIGLIFWWQISRIKYKNRQQQELTSSKLAAIKSQMNPHFIFNALNSIQDLILKEDIDNSYSYIVKFSNLVRKTLSYSDLDFIDLEDEINLLSIYLELEKLRIRDNFYYEIIDEVGEEIQIPPMLIQPFVENALKHGLLHKEGKKQLFLTFQLSDMLICTIADNGIGREKAREIKARQKKQHESFSVDATKTRFEILKKHYKKPLGLEYEDLYDATGLPAGTRVVLRIPYRQEF